MPYQEAFGVEQFMDTYETKVKYNLGETCCFSLNLDEIAHLSGEKFELDGQTRLNYGAIKGSDELRTLIASIYGSQFTMDDVLVTNGAIGANFLLYYALVGPGDHVISVAPTYNQLYSVPRMFGAEVDLIELVEVEDFEINLERLKSLIKDNTKLIILNNPNNPLGNIIPSDKLQEICSICKAHDIYLHCDEVYRPLFHSLPKNVKEPKSACQLYANAISTGSMSKAYSAAGIRLGWMITKNTKVLRDAASRRDYNTISVSKIDDEVAQYVLKHRDVILERNYKLCLSNLKMLTQFVEGSCGKYRFVTAPQAGSVCLIKPAGVKNTIQFAQFIAEKWKILLVPGDLFGVSNSLRLGYGNSEDDLSKGLALLEEAYDEWMSLQDEN